MFQKLRRAIAARHLAYLQRHNASQLARLRFNRQHLIMLAREAHSSFDAQEAKLARRATQLHVREIELNHSIEDAAHA